MDAVTHLNSIIGSRYLVEREIARGGMATVYLARDVRHRRSVAIKVLHADLGASIGAERFLAEIAVTANLQHPNLLPLFDSGEANGQLFYVMPFVAGESLRARLAREKLLPVDEAVAIAVAVASALDYAHRHGVIHRDLKPENILLHEGEPLVADFGIALAVSRAGGDRITQSGLTIGTPQYMSPEQATGDRTIDARTDVYSLAAVLYEMLTGEPPHSGPTVQAVIARVIADTPRRVRMVRASVPEHVEWAIDRALAKFPADRFNTAREFADCLAKNRLPHTPTRGGLVAHRRLPGRLVDALTSAWLRRSLPWIVAAAGIPLAVIADRRFVSPRNVVRTSVRVPVDLEPGQALASVYGPLALSPDGTMIAFVGTDRDGPPRLFVRTVNDARARELPGTEGAAQPFFSPDGLWVGFYAARSLKKVALGGGRPVLLSELDRVVGASWSPGGDVIVVSTEGKLALVPAHGGAPRFISSPDSGAGERAQVTPRILGDEKTVVYASRRRFLEESRIGIASVGGGPPKILSLSGTAPLGIIDDHLVYASVHNRTRANTIMAVRFDMRRREVIGDPVVMTEGLDVHGLGFAAAGLSRSGSLLYMLSEPPIAKLVVARPGGEPRVVLADPRPYYFPRFSPDARRIALSTAQNTESQWRIDIFDRMSGTMTPVTTDGNYPEWTGDGNGILYASGDDLWLRPADLDTPAQLLLSQEGMGIVEGSLSIDGRALVVRVNRSDGNRDLWYRRMVGDTAVKPLVEDQSNEFGPRLSPDARWVAYWSEEFLSHGSETHVHITAFPGPGPRYRVSTSGGAMPVWSRDGRRLFYVQDGQLLAASLKLGPAFAVTSRDTLFRTGFDQPDDVPYHANYDVSVEGEVVFPRRVDRAPQVILLHDWKYDLRQRLSLPATR